MSNSNISKTYRELIHRIRTLLDKQGFPSRSIRFPLSIIYNTVLEMRTSFLKRTKVSRQGIGVENIQTIACVELENTDENICSCNPPSGCTWSKSIKPIPKSIALMSVTNTNANFKAEFVEWSKFKSKMKSRSAKKDSRYFTILDTGEGPYLYLYNDIFLEKVSIMGLWENPNDAIIYSCGKETKFQKKLRCSPFDTPLYMDGDMIDVVFKMTIDFLSRTTSLARLDKKNDSLDNTSEFENPTV